jgi:hypothetical protein
MTNGVHIPQASPAELEQRQAMAKAMAERVISNNIQKIKTTIFVTFQKHGLHRYPGAPDEVQYLASPHRHLFKFRVTIEVFHDDREIEFHMFQNWLMGLYEDKQLPLDFKSCEMIAAQLMQKIFDKYGYMRDIEIEVNEDGECGATLKFEGVKGFDTVFLQGKGEASA